MFAQDLSNRRADAVARAAVAAAGGRVRRAIVPTPVLDEIASARAAGQMEALARRALAAFKRERDG